MIRDKSWVLKHYLKGIVSENVFDAVVAKYGVFKESPCGGGFEERLLPRVDNILLVLLKRTRAELDAAASQKAESEREKFQRSVAEEVVRQRGRDERHLKRTVLSKLARELASDD